VLDDSKADVPIITLSAVRARVEATAARLTTWEKIMFPLKDQYNARPTLITGLSLTLVAFFVIALVPLSYTDTVGYNATISGIRPESRISPALLTAALSAIGYDSVAVSVSPDSIFSEYTIRNLPSESEARDVAAAFVALTGQAPETRAKRNVYVEAESLRVRAFDGELARVKVVPVVEVASASLYTRIAERVRVRHAQPQPVRIRFEDGEFIINGEKFKRLLGSPVRSDVEVKAAIESTLVKSGLTENDITVLVETDSAGRYRAGRYRIVRLVQAGADTALCSDLDVHLDCCGREVFAKFNREEWETARDSAIKVEFLDNTITGRTITITVKLIDKQD